MHNVEYVKQKDKQIKKMYCVKLTRNYKLKNKDLQLGIRNKFNASQKLRIVDQINIFNTFTSNSV